MKCQLEFSCCTRLEADVVTHQTGRQLRRHWITEDARAPAPAIQSVVSEFERIPVDAWCVEYAAPLPIHSAHLEQIHEVRVQLENERQHHGKPPVVVQPQVLVARRVPQQLRST